MVCDSRLQCTASKNSIPVSGVLSRFTTSSIVVPDIVSPPASSRREVLFHMCAHLDGGVGFGVAWGDRLEGAVSRQVFENRRPKD